MPVCSKDVIRGEVCVTMFLARQYIYRRAAVWRCGLAYINKHIGSTWCGVSGNPRTFLLAQTSANYTRASLSLSLSLSLSATCANWLAYGQTAGSPWSAGTSCSDTVGCINDVFTPPKGRSLEVYLMTLTLTIGEYRIITDATRRGHGVIWERAGETAMQCL
jgi:hypothetical protein